MRTFVVGVTLVLLALPASAQIGTKPGTLQNGNQKQTDKPKINDKDYRNALGNLPDKKFDPWKDMR